MQIAYLYNKIIKDADNLTRLLYFIKSDPEFQAIVNKFWCLFNKNHDGHILRSDFLEIATLIYTFLLPEFTFAHHKKIAEQKIGKIFLNNKFIYDNFAQFFIELAFEGVQNLDLKSTVGFLELVFHRITDLAVVNSQNSEKQKLHYEIEVHIYSKEDVEKQSIEPKLEKHVLINTLYYQEKVVYNHEEIKNNQTYSTVVELKKQENVIPLGFICDSVLFELTNSSFKHKDRYTLIPHERIQNLQNIKVTATFQEKVIDPLKDSLLNKQRMHTTFVVHKYLPSHEQKIHGNFNAVFYRINEYFSRETYFEQLKNLKDELKFFNILSAFHDRHDFNIDQVHNVGQKWHRKRKANMMAEERKKTIKKLEINLDEELRLFESKIVQKYKKFLNQDRLNSHLNFLKDKLRTSLEEDKIINLERFLSNSDVLPYDNDSPFENDILEYAKQIPLQLLVVGRPKCGKTTLAKKLASKYQIVHVSLENAINKIFERVKFFEQNPPETDEDGVPKDGLTAIQKCIIEDLSLGKRVSEEDVLDLLNKQLKNPNTANKGFILDLPLQYIKEYNWVEKIIANQIYTPKIGCRYFTHIIQMQQSEQQWKYFVKGIMEKPQDYTLSSGLDRYLLVKPKPLPEEGEQQQVGDQQKPQPLIQANLIANHQSSFALPNIHYLVTHLHPRNHLKIKIAGKSISEIVDLLDINLYKIPLAKKIEGNQKQLLSVGLEEKKLFRKWSEWGIIDPVELYKKRLVAGKSEFAAEYAGRVFLFQQEKNLNDFLSDSRRYLKVRPELPKTFNLVINGPRKSGKKSVAKLLSEIYGLKIVNIEEIVTKKLVQQKNFVQPIPSNFDKRSSSIHLSQPQWKQFNKGNAVSAKDVLPIVFFELGIKLQKKPVDWGIERTQEQKAQIQKERQQRQKEQLSKKSLINAKKGTKKKQKEAKQDDRPKTTPLEDLALKDIIPLINHLNKLDQVRGFIFVGYPSNEEQLQAFKNFNIPIDKFIYLSDNSEENPNKNLSTRLNQAQLEQVTTFNTAMNVIKQALTQEVFKEINIGDSLDNITIKIRNVIDPFFVKPDEDANNRVSADVQEQDDPIQYGFCQNYCPVVLSQKWLVKGKDEFQCGVRGKRFKCFSEKEFNTFKQNPSIYLNKKNLQIPPRLLFMGIRGVGLKTQLIKINQKYKIPILNLKENLISHLQNQKIRRKTDRYYNKGFKVKQFDQQGKQIEDPELNEQAADFDRKAKQIQVLRNVFEGIQQILINGNFFDVDEEKVSTNLVELLSDARRLPEAVIMLKVDQKKWLQRVFNPKQIEKEHEKLVNDLRQQKIKEKQEAKKKALQAGQQYNEPAQQQDLGAPKLEDMINQRKQKLVAQRQADLAKLQEYSEAFKTANVQVIMLDCQRDISHVFDKINYAIKPYLQNRIQKWEKVDMLKITSQRVPHFLQNFIVKQSRFGKLNPFTLVASPKPCPLIYRDRLYYLESEQERDAIMQNPELLTTNRSVPHNVVITPRVFIIGKPKSGKKSLARLMQKKLGFVIIKIKKLIQQFATEHKDPLIEKILNHLKSGEVLTDEMIVDLIEKRVQFSDCIKKGWVLTGFPANKAQAELLAKRGLTANAVLSIQLSDNDIKKRILPLQSNGKYSYNLTVVNERLQKINKQIINLENYFMNKFNNIKFLDGKISKWGIFQIAKEFVLETVKIKKQFVRSLVCKQPSSAVHIGFPFNALLNNLSDYSNYCLVTYKTQREYVRSNIYQHRWLSLYKKKIYVLNSQKQYQDFLTNPDLYLISPLSNFAPPELLLSHKIPEVYDKIQNKGYCIVDLTKKTLTKGNPTYSIIYKDKIFGISKSINIKHFLRNPMAYQMSKLQDKLPVSFDKKNELKKIAKKSDCTAFLEHHLGNIMMRVLAQLGYRRLKYPTLSSKQTALKFLAISLKANNANKDEQYRQKYKQKLQQFIKHCSYPQQLRDEFQRKQKSKDNWNEWDEQNLLKLAQQYNEFLKELNSQKVSYFSKFIQ